MCISEQIVAGQSDHSVAANARAGPEQITRAYADVRVGMARKHIRPGLISVPLPGQALAAE